ncbi:hypothetical protein Taro_006028 [Colocasia esculenta]|uniref:Uncharacterized protein n=1 Tax=Colocasia esculenta TaxID=4460 RepID=A0A843TZG9_COLES|nr:hypothetical protein [Colocasia esculenta]
MYVLTYASANGAWAEIYPFEELFITFGVEWLAVRHATMTSEPTSCVLQPPLETLVALSWFYLHLVAAS